MASQDNGHRHNAAPKEIAMDTMNITILEDGTIKAETDKISGINHMTAEALLRNLAGACGGKQQRTHKRGVLGAVGHAIQHAFGSGHSH
jgi:hypothetical protein